MSTVYSGTKRALDALTGVRARELGPKGIRVNSINPGMIETEGAQTMGMLGFDLEKCLISQAPLGRTGKVDDLNRLQFSWPPTIPNG
jgi:3-oxoacyl-[acyl-carrier protein] reductase